MISDTISYLSGVKLPFVKKYAATLDPVKIINLRDALAGLLSMSLRMRLTSQSEFMKNLGEMVWGEENIGGKKRLDVLGMAILGQMETLKQIFIERSIRSEQRHLVDFNYTIEKVLSSSAQDVESDWLVLLELFVMNNHSGKIERTVIEMNRDELSTFIQQLAKFQEEV